MSPVAVTSPDSDVSGGSDVSDGSDVSGGSEVSDCSDISDGRHWPLRSNAVYLKLTMRNFFFGITHTGSFVRSRNLQQPRARSKTLISWRYPPTQF